MEQKLPKLTEEQRIDNIKRLERARLAFDDTMPIREERERNFRYYVGDQWSDLMKDPDTGEMISEETFIRKQGRIPAKQNLIGKTIRNLAGQFRTNYPDPVAFGRSRGNASAGEMMTSALQYALDINEANELDAQNMKEFSVGGVVGWKVGYKWWSQLDREDLYINNLDATRIFYNADANDIRGMDITIIGELHDLTLNEIMSKFGFSIRDKEKLLSIFPDARADDWEINNFPQHIQKFRDFYIPDNPDKLRVIEVWERGYEDMDFLHDYKDGYFEPVDKQFFIDNGYDPEIINSYSLEEIVQLLNQARVDQAAAQGVGEDAVAKMELHSRYEECWRVYYLSPNGDLILSMKSPYDHQEHPYVLGRYMMDGKVLSLCSSIIDQQRHVNRLISMIDASLGRSLKKVMMVDVDSIPAQYKGNLQEYADDMVQMNGFAFYTSQGGKLNMPKEIQSASFPVEAMSLLNLQSELLKDISAVTDAVQGKEPSRQTPASLYAQQTLNASITNKDIFDFYYGLIRKRNRKVVKVIKQFYSEPRYIKISGTGYDSGVDSMYDPNEVRDVDFDVVVGEAQQTLAYRQNVDVELKEFLSGQLITFREYLQTTSMPYADKLLQLLDNREEKQQEDGQPPVGLTPEQMQSMAEQGGLTPNQ